MNTIRSTWIGWGSLCVAGGGAYYFAKRQINADRESRFQEENQRKELQRRMEALQTPTSSSSSVPPPPPRRKGKSSGKGGKEPTSDGDVGLSSTRGLDHAGSPSGEISEDAAPVGHAPEDEGQRVQEKSKYEAAEPFRSRKGDRFS